MESLTALLTPAWAVSIDRRAGNGRNSHIGDRPRGDTGTGRLIPGFLSGINLAGLRSPLRLAEKVMHQLVSTFGTFARGRHEVTCPDKGLR